MDTARELVLIDQAKRAITEATSIDDVREIMDKAAALRLYFRKAKESLDIQNRAAEIKLRAERRAGELIRELALDRGRRSDLVARGDQVISNGKPILKDLGVTKSQSSRWQSIASVSDAAFDAHIQRTRDARRELTTSSVLKLAKARRFHAATADPPYTTPASATAPTRLAQDLYGLLDDGERFGCIYADPPWDAYPSIASAKGSQLETTLVDLCQLPVKRLTLPEAHLHLWTTDSALFDAKHVIEAWGFTYVASFVWVQPVIENGAFWNCSHRILLLGVRGASSFRDQRPCSWLNSKRLAGDQKPESIRKLIESVSAGPFLQLFGVSAPAGWTVCDPRPARVGKEAPATAIA